MIPKKKQIEKYKKIKAMIKNYIFLALRNLIRNKFQTAFSILGLAVAFFCFGICMYFVHGFLSMDSYYENNNRTMKLAASHSLRGVRTTAINNLVEQFPEIEALFRYEIETYTYNCEEWPENLEMITIECDTTLRHLYNPRLLAGSWQGAEHSINSFVLCETWAKRLFQSPENAIGKQFTCMGGKRFSDNPYATPTYTVQAVVEDLPYNNTLQPFSPMTAWVMNDTDGKLAKADHEFVYFYDPRILLKEGVDKGQFAARVDNACIFESEMDNIEGGKNSYYISVDEPFDPVKSYGNYGIYAFMLLVFAFPGLLILLSALSNFFHLLLSSIMMRRREYTLRRAVGAHTADLWIMVSTQVIVTMLLVGFCTLLIVELCSPLLSVKVDQYQLVLDPTEMLRQSAWHIGALLLIGFGVAWMAVARVRKDSLQESMKTSTGRRPGKHIGRNILLGWQMSIGFLFIILLSALVLQINVNSKARMSWITNEEKDQIVLMPYYCHSLEEHQQQEAELRALPSVKEICFQHNSQYMFQFNAYSWEHFYNENGDSLLTYISLADTSVIRFLHLPLFEGRWPEKNSEVVVDTRFVKKYNLGIGETLTPMIPENMNRILNAESGEAFTIVGVTDNLQLLSAANNRGVRTSKTGIYIFDRNYHYGTMACKCYPGQLEAMRRDLNGILKKHNILGGAEFDFPTFFEEIEKENNVEREFLGLFWLFAGIALVITLLGIYSAITMDTTARRKEMAIRKINGAKTWHIALRFCRLYLVLMVITAAIVFPITYIFFHYFGEIGYRETFHYGFGFYACVFLTMAVFVAITIGVQVWKIAHIEPAKVVKSE